KDNDVFVSFSGFATEFERVADKIGNRVEERRLHVVVTEYDSVLFFLESIDLDRQLRLETQFKIGNRVAQQPAQLLVHLFSGRLSNHLSNFRHATNSRLTSNTCGECVRAPTEMKSTPVLATSRTVSSVTLPDASSLALPSQMATASRIVAIDMLSSRIRSTPSASASRTLSSERVSTSISKVVPEVRTRWTAAVIEPAKSMWLSFINTMSKRPVRWFCPPPSRTASLSVVRRPGAVLRVSRMTAFVDETASTNMRVNVAIPDIRPRKFSATRSPVRSARAGPSTSASTVRRVTLEPSSTFDSNVTLSLNASITCFAM